MKYLYLLPLAVLMLVACSVEVPGGVIPEGKMEDILYDYHLAQGMAEASSGDVNENRKALIAKVFEKYDITQAEFDSSMVWYSGHASHLQTMYEHIGNRMEKETARLGLDAENDVYANLKEYGDTAAIWKGECLCLLNQKGRNVVSYTIKSDSSFHKGDTYMIRFSSRFVSQDMRREGYVLLIARYDNDSTAFAYARIGGDYDSNAQIARSSLTDNHNVKSIQVYFYFSYDQDQMNSFRLWMVQQPTLIRFHHDDEAPVAQPKQETKDSVLKTVPDSFIHAKPTPGRPERLNPEEMRNSHEGEHTIKVVRQRKVILPARPRRGMR